MTYQLERKAIETFFATAWGATSPLGLDGQEFTPTDGSVLLTIQSGAVLQGTVGSASNRLDHIGLVQVQIFTASGKGSADWRTLAETVETALRGKIIDNAGVAITDPADAFVRFSPQDQHPYIAGVNRQAPLITATINAPFVRYSYS